MQYQPAISPQKENQNGITKEFWKMREQIESQKSRESAPWCKE